MAKARHRASRGAAGLAFLVLLLVLQGCTTLGITKDREPLSKATLGTLNAIGAEAGSAMLVRVFKASSGLEVFKANGRGEYQLLRTYPICKWSGELGPKLKEGDLQSPEGFYSVTPAQMNPKSGYYLSFNIGFPNRYDRAFERTGSNLMVHGDCKSVGCFAVTDEHIKEIYALARESFAAGNPSFQIEIYPFRMTAENLEKYSSSPHASFWRNLKEGYDAFEATRKPAKVDVCGGRYVFNSPRDLSGADPLASCPI